MKPSVCFPLTVETLSIPMKIESEGVLLCSVLINQPVVKGEVPRAALRRINAFYAHFTKTLQHHANTGLKKTAKEDYEYRKENGFPFFPYELRSDFTVTFNNKGLLGLYTDVYEYTGGAHGNTRRFADIWYTYSGLPATAADFFPKGTNIKKLLTDAAKAEAAAEISAGTGVYFDNYTELIKKYYSAQNIFLQENGLSLFYQQYEIAPYSEGIPVFTVPYNELTGPTIPECPPKSMLGISL